MMNKIFCRKCHDMVYAVSQEAAIQTSFDEESNQIEHVSIKRGEQRVIFCNEEVVGMNVDDDFLY